MSKSDARPLQAFSEEFRVLRESGPAADALAFGMSLFSDYSDQLEAGDLTATTLLCELGELLNEQGDAEQAEELFRRAVKTAEEHGYLALIARACTGLALLMDHQGRYEEAQGAYGTALDAASRLPEPNMRQVATLTNNLAIVCKELGRFDEAETLYLRAVQIYKDIHQQSHPDLASAMNNLGVFYLQRGDLQNAETMNIKALIMRQKECHPSDPDIAQSYSNLAAVYHMRGWLDKAENFYQKALSAFAHCKHPPLDERETTIRNYIALLRMLGNDALAEKLEKRL